MVDDNLNYIFNVLRSIFLLHDLSILKICLNTIISYKAFLSNIPNIPTDLFELLMGH